MLEQKVEAELSVGAAGMSERSPEIPGWSQFLLARPA